MLNFELMFEKFKVGG